MRLDLVDSDDRVKLRFMLFSMAQCPMCRTADYSDPSCTGPAPIDGIAFAFFHPPCR
jgi:hypothetical protein